MLVVHLLDIIFLSLSIFFFSSRRRHTILVSDWSSDVCSSDLYAFDPSLNLMYYGTGNPSTWNPTQRPGDNKWSMTIFARDVDTGKAKWAYQMTPWDAWDYDGVNEMILADLTRSEERRVGKECRME